MSVGAEGSGPNPRTYSRAEYAALEAENARLVEDVKKWQALAQNVETLERITESAEARRAQLAAIQGWLGEDVVVLATVSMGGVEYGIGGAELGDIDIQPDMKALCALQQSLVTGEDDAYVELIDKAQHQRITAAMAAEVERLRTALSKANEQTEHFERNWYLVSDERDALRAELAEVKGREAVPVAWMLADAVGGSMLEFQQADLMDCQRRYGGEIQPLYATPPASPDVEGLVKALEQAIADIEDWAAYASPYFQEKHDLAGCLENHRTALSTWRQSHP